MQVVIIGAGEVGTVIAESLASEHEVIVIDKDEDIAEKLQYDLDVLTMAADGTSLETQETANVGNADMFLACTDDDRTNLVACGTAKVLGDPFTIARTKSVEYLRTWERDNTAFGADFVVCSDLQTAENIVNVIGLPAAIDMELFAGGLVQLAEFQISSDSPLTGQTIAQADRFDSLTFAGLFRDHEVLIPVGDTVIEAGDRAVVIGSPRSVQSFAKDVAPATTPESADDIVIVGGSPIGYQIARLLEKRKLEPTLIEQNETQARELAEDLPGTLVMQHDATDTEFLSREHIDEADVAVAALTSDEQNLLVASLAKRLGVERVISVVENSQYVELFEEIGIDVAVNPRTVTAEEIVRFSFASVAENLAVLENDQAEVLELELGAESPLVGCPIADLDAELDGQFVIGAITRDRSRLTPRGDTVLKAGDHIIVFAEPDVAAELASMT